MSTRSETTLARRSDRWVWLKRLRTDKFHLSDPLDSVTSESVDILALHTYVYTFHYHM